MLILEEEMTLKICGSNRHWMGPYALAVLRTAMLLNESPFVTRSHFFL